jgi:hypothetical protein
MSPEQHYPYEKGVKGIAFEPLLRECGPTINSHVIRTEQGYPIELTMLGNRLSAQALHFQSPTIPYKASMSAAVDSDGELQFFIYTKLCEAKHTYHNAPYPDFYGAEFVKFSFWYFKSIGAHIEYVHSIWALGSVNFKQFIDFQKQNISVKDAAAQTWTGRQIEQFGFIPDPLSFSKNINNTVYEIDFVRK